MNKVGILPTCWGPAMWFSLHSIAYAYNPQIDKGKYYDFFSNLGYILPCEECRVHYSQNLNKQELVIALENSENLFRWVYDLHNKVNKQTGVPESKWPSYESVKQRYGSFKASCTDIPGVCGSGPGPQKKVKVIEQFGSINEDQLPFLISTVILAILLAVAIFYIIYLKRSQKR
jgi:hypothetical protein